MVYPDHEHREPIESQRRALRREWGRGGLRDRAIDGGVDLLDDLMPARVESVDRALRLRDCWVVGSGTASFVFQAPLLEVAAEQIEQPSDDGSR